jgi:hypothetical protein
VHCSTLSGRLVSTTPKTEFMRNMLHSGNTHAHLDSVSRSAADETRSVKSPGAEGGSVDFGKVNLILIGLIVVILFGLLSREDGSTSYSSREMRMQTQEAVSEAGPEANAAAVETDVPEMTSESTAQTEASAMPAQAVPTKPSSKPNSKKVKKTETVEPEPAQGPVVEMHASQALPVVEPVQQKDTSRKMLVFNIWSVSELRLRSTYTTFMNDSSIPAAQLEARKKDYLSFVNHRAKKCGELDNKFAGNINTVERLTFSKGDVDILECHAAENNSELDKLHASREQSF